jgi:hypothetical protein
MAVSYAYLPLSRRMAIQVRDILLWASKLAGGILPGFGCVSLEVYTLLGRYIVDGRQQVVRSSPVPQDKKGMFQLGKRHRQTVNTRIQTYAK